MTVRAVLFDIGETLINEGRIWSRWADWLGVSQFTFFAALGSVIERREPHLRVFEFFRPGFNLEREEAAMALAGTPNIFDATYLYPDVVPCLEALKDQKFWTGIAGNQPAWSEDRIRAMNLPVDFIGVSATLQAIKPSPEFFRRAIEKTPFPAHEVAYVGDRLDNDVLPARSAGMVSIFLRRGPWGMIHSRWPEAAQADLVIDGLSELPLALVE